VGAKEGAVSARDNILRRIRTRSGRRGETPAAELALARAHIARHERGPLPALARGDPIARFIAECGRLKTSVAQPASIDEVPLAIARYLDSEGLEPRLTGWHEFAALDWPAAGIAFEDRPARGSDPSGLTGCFCAIGETGTLLLLGSAATPKATALLPETHFCVVRRQRIVATMEDAFALLRQEIGEPPRATFFVSGPSRTADIEQTIVIGAHGPYRVHVLLV
jgi:L-lactate dehydrogenase complex protein LldG